MSDNNQYNDNGFGNFIQKAFPWILGASSIGLIASLANKLTKPAPRNFNKDLLFTPQFFDMDPICAQYFLRLQCWRHHDSQNFDKAGDEADVIFGKLSGVECGILLNEQHEEAVAAYRNLLESLEIFSKQCKKFLRFNLNDCKERFEQNEKDERLKEEYSQKKAITIDNIKYLEYLVQEIEKRMKSHIYRLMFKSQQNDDDDRDNQGGDNVNNNENTDQSTENTY